LPKIEGLAYRPIGADARRPWEASPSGRVPGWSAYRFVMGDHSLAEHGIYEDDIVQVLSAPKPHEYTLRLGMIVLVRHTLEGPQLEQLSARLVLSAPSDHLALAIRPKPGASKAIMAEYGADTELPQNVYRAEGGGTVEVLGIVAAIERH